MTDIENSTQNYQMTQPIPFLSTNPKEMKTCIQTKTCTQMFTAALFTAARRRKQPKCPSTEEWVHKMWNAHKLVYCSALKRKYWYMLPHGSGKEVRHERSYVRGFQLNERSRMGNPDTENTSEGARDSVKGGRGRLFYVYRASFQGDGNVLEKEATVGQHHQCTKCCWTVHFKVVNFTLCEFYLDDKKRANGRRRCTHEEKETASVKKFQAELEQGSGWRETWEQGKDFSFLFEKRHPRAHAVWMTRWGGLIAGHRRTALEKREDSGHEWRSWPSREYC